MIEIYTDGAFSTSRQMMGWAFIVVIDNQKHFSNYDGIPEGTNNRAEMYAFLESTIWMKKNNIKEAKIYLDSLYVINSMLGKYSRKKNLDLWKILDDSVENLSIDYCHVKGHNGNKWNELCDTLAVAGSHLIIN